jgi:hypothetical protein
MCVFHSSQFTFMTRNQAAQPPNIIVDTKSGGKSAPDLVSKSVVAFQANFKLRHYRKMLSSPDFNCFYFLSRSTASSLESSTTIMKNQTVAILFLLATLSLPVAAQKKARRLTPQS